MRSNRVEANWENCCDFVLEGKNSIFAVPFRHLHLTICNFLAFYLVFFFLFLSCCLLFFCTSVLKDSQWRWGRHHHEKWREKITFDGHFCCFMRWHGLQIRNRSNSRKKNIHTLRKYSCKQITLKSRKRCKRMRRRRKRKKRLHKRKIYDIHIVSLKKITINI